MSFLYPSDHEQAAHAHQVAIHRTTTLRQRQKQALRMNRMMRDLLVVGYRSRHPDWNETDVKRAVAYRILHAGNRLTEQFSVGATVLPLHADDCKT